MVEMEQLERFSLGTAPLQHSRAHILGSNARADVGPLRDLVMD